MTRLEIMQTFFNGAFVALLFIGRQDCKNTLEEAYDITVAHYKTQPIFRVQIPYLKEWVDSL